MATSSFFPAATRKTWRLLGDLQFICAATESGKSNIFTAAWQSLVLVALSRFFNDVVFSVLVGTDQTMILFRVDFMLDTKLQWLFSNLQGIK